MSRNRFGEDFDSVLKVYVAGKLNDDAVGYLKNVHNMMRIAEMLNNSGLATYVPAIDLLMGIKFGYDDYHQYFDNSQPWLLAADMVVVCPGWETSEGTKREIALAEEKYIPVFYVNKDDEQKVIDEIKEYFE